MLSYELQLTCVYPYNTGLFCSYKNKCTGIRLYYANVISAVTGTSNHQISQNPQPHTQQGLTFPLTAVAFFPAQQSSQMEDMWVQGVGSARGDRGRFHWPGHSRTEKAAQSDSLASLSEADSRARPFLGGSHYQMWHQRKVDSRAEWPCHPSPPDSACQQLHWGQKY